MAFLVTHSNVTKKLVVRSISDAIVILLPGLPLGPLAKSFSDITNVRCRRCTFKDICMLLNAYF